MGGSPADPADNADIFKTINSNQIPPAFSHLPLAKGRSFAAQNKFADNCSACGTPPLSQGEVPAGRRGMIYEFGKIVVSL